MSDQSGGERVRVDYTNYRGERAIRTITPWGVEWGSTEHHPEPQWLLTCYDHDKLACRTYALRDIHAWNGVPTENPVALSAVPVGSQSGGDPGAQDGAEASGWRPIVTAPDEGEFLAGLHVRVRDPKTGAVSVYEQQHVIAIDEETGDVADAYDQGWRLLDYEWWKPLDPLPAPALTNPPTPGGPT